MITRGALTLSISLLIAQGAVAQQNSNAELAELRAQIRALTARLDELELRDQATVPATAVTVAAPTVSSSSWPDRVRLSGDLRYRHETINDDASTERHRQRIRARIGIAAEIGDDLTVGVTLATGADNPISANQTLDTGFSRKSIGVDRAFFDWSINETLSIRGGKMANPMFRPGGHHLIYDGDLNPEGLAMRYDGGRFFANFAGFWVEERGAGDDSILRAAQAGYRGQLTTGAGFTAGVSLYDYSNLQGQSPFFDGMGHGNRLDTNGNYLNDFELVELFAEASFELGGEPLRLFADYVANNGVDDLDEGFAIGLNYRSATDPGSWEIGWAYQDLEADAVVASFTDSDFAGGGTDGRGHIFRGSYIFRERWNLGLTYFLNERGEAAGNPRDYKRLQADVSFRY
jgi:hypothetical protein